MEAPMVKSDLYPKDIVAETIINSFKWSPLRTAIYAFLWTWITEIAIAALNGRFLPQEGYISFVEDYYHQFISVGYAFAWGYYVWLYKALANVIEELDSSAVITMDPSQIERAKKILRNKSSQLMIILFTMLGVTLNFYQNLHAEPIWSNASVPLLVLRYLVWLLPSAYVIVTILIRYISYVQVLQLVLKDVKLHPLHPDRAGGLLPLGRYALTSTYPLAVAGSMAAMALYWSRDNAGPEQVIFYFAASIVYIVFAPWMFFAPLSSAHNAMLKAKKDLKAKISRQFDNDYSLAYNEVSGSASQLKEKLDKLEQLQKMESMAESFPVWPFDIQIIRRFTLTMFSPVLGVLLSILTTFLNRTLFPPR